MALPSAGIHLCTLPEALPPATDYADAWGWCHRDPFLRRAESDDLNLPQMPDPGGKFWTTVTR
jgi:hypothetical protein